MSKFFKRTALVVGLLAVSVLGLAGFYKASLPDSFKVSKGGKLMLNTVFSISAEPNDSSAQANATEISSESSDCTLMLFGAVPIKEVSSMSVNRPYLVPCGQAFGIKLITDGVMVVDFSKLEDCCPAKDCGLKKGDVITSINGEQVKSNSDVSKIISHCKGSDCKIVFNRDGEEKWTMLSPVLYGGAYKAGMWVRDSSAGIGTLTFYNSETGTFGGLGHPVCDADTKEIIPISKGAVGDIKITGVQKSSKGSPGQLLGEFASSASLGEITINCENGVFGTLSVCPSDEEAIPMGFRQEIKKGAAKIICSLDGEKTQNYSVSIEEICTGENSAHDLVIKVTDKELLKKTGGIVQGMSGSPIIQDGKLVGAVTHVFIDDPTFGYGIFADEMYNMSLNCENACSDKAG